MWTIRLTALKCDYNVYIKSVLSHIANIKCLVFCQLITGIPLVTEHNLSQMDKNVCTHFHFFRNQSKPLWSWSYGSLIYN
jgi:hypothetical protein